METPASDNRPSSYTGIPTRTSVVVFAMKSFGLRMRRKAVDALRPTPKHKPLAGVSLPVRLVSSTTRLATANGDVERNMELGKVQNLRIVAQVLDGIVVPAGQEFSFWRQVGKCNRRRGFVMGRQLQEGCLIPAVGGGICQLTNVLFDLAVKAGAEITERHSHSRIVPGSMAAEDRDATVAWNYIDLRFRPPSDWQLRVRLDADHLIVEIYGEETATGIREARPRTPLRTILEADKHSCGTCGQLGCYLHDLGLPPKPLGSTAFMVDEFWPEFDQYLREIRSKEDLLLVPRDGCRWNRPRYCWSTKGYAKVGTATYSTLLRGLRSRRLAAQGAERQKALLHEAEILADVLDGQIPYNVEHVVVTQTLLPFLWLSGVLGGRSFDVLMTRKPMIELHSVLDGALAEHPERVLLGDFRAPNVLCEAEAAALERARKLITPHRSLMAGDFRKVLLDWEMPPAKTWSKGPVIVFPGPTVSRKGAYELREVAKKLNLEVGLLGGDLEGSNFWDGVRTHRLDPRSNWPEGVAAVVQPALIEDKPRSLLLAVASGCPVIASSACGIGGLPGVTELKEISEACLLEALAEVIGGDRL